MGNKIRLTESELIKLIKKVISEQEAGPDEDILMSLEDMGFGKSNCPKYDKSAEMLGWEYCHNQKPFIMVSYPKPYDSIEIMNLKDQKIIDTIDNPTAEELESVIKSIFPY